MMYSSTPLNFRWTIPLNSYNELYCPLMQRPGRDGDGTSWLFAQIEISRAFRLQVPGLFFCPIASETSEGILGKAGIPVPIGIFSPNIVSPPEPLFASMCPPTKQSGMIEPIFNSRYWVLTNNTDFSGFPSFFFVARRFSFHILLHFLVFSFRHHFPPWKHIETFIRTYKFSLLLISKV